VHELSWETARLPSPCDTSGLDKSLIDGTWKTALSRLVDDKVDFKSFKKAFEETSKIELAGVLMPMEALVVVGGVLFGMVRGKEDEKAHSVPLPSPQAGLETFIKDLKRDGMIKKTVTQHNEQVGAVTIITLRRPLHLKIPSSKVLQEGGK
jgi:hypothetical protein